MVLYLPITYGAVGIDQILLVGQSHSVIVVWFGVSIFLKQSSCALPNKYAIAARPTSESTTVHGVTQQELV